MVYSWIKVELPQLDGWMLLSFQKNILTSALSMAHVHVPHTSHVHMAHIYNVHIQYVERYMRRSVVGLCLLFLLSVCYCLLLKPIVVFVLLLNTKTVFLS